MALAELKKLAENLRDLTKDLLAQSETAEKILNEYKDKFTDVADIKNGLAEIKDELQKLQNQATDKQVIVFVGAVDSGKSSLINALLRDDRLPTSTGESTVCSFKIATTVEDEWSLQLDGDKDKQYGDDFKKIMEACSKSAFPDSRAIREKLNITAKSVLQVNWPEKLCTSLPPNVVLYDTPGLGEDSEVLETLKEPCKTADIIVTVMETKTPSLQNISKLVNEANLKEGGKVIFGVYTKWEEFKEKSRRKRNVPVDLEFVRKEHNRNYLKKIYGKERTATAAAAAAATEEEEEEEEENVFFVDVGCGEYFKEKAGNEGTEGFLKFERCLGSAKELQLRSLEKKANSVKSETGKVFKMFQGIIEKRKEEKQEQLDKKLNDKEIMEEELKAFTEVTENVKSPKEIMDALFTEDKIVELLAKFDDLVKICEEEEDVIEVFGNTVKDEIKLAVDKETERINQKYKKWKKTLKSKASRPFVLPEELPCYEFSELTLQQELPRHLYNQLFDVHTYITSRHLWRCLIVGGGAAAMVTIPGQLIATVGAIVPEVAVKGFMGLMGSGMMAHLERVSNDSFGIMSQKKIACWKKVLSEKLRTHPAGNSKNSTPIQKEIDSIFKFFSEATKKTMDEYQKLTEDLEDLEKWSADLKKIKPQPRSKTPMDVSGDPTENQSVNGSAGTSS